MDRKELKQKLYEASLDFISERIKGIQKAIEQANEAGLEETKSSAGDKHEVGKAMAQLEQEKNQAQLQQALLLQNQLYSLKVSVNENKIMSGSFVRTDKGDFYLLTGIGKVILNSKSYFIISPASPLGQKFIASKKADVIKFNDQQYRIIDFF